MADESKDTSEHDHLAGCQKTTIDDFRNVPIKVVKGDTNNVGLTFNLKPGAVVAHPGSAVIFVCG